MNTEVKDSSKKTPPKHKNHWKNGLIRSLADPALKVLEDDLVVIIKDTHPKANYHFLVCCKADIPGLKNLKPGHIQLLKHMEKMGEQIAEKHNGKKFLIGYHAIPSMNRLHLHIVSDDFNSKFLKTKKHWNSFNTDFFIPSPVLIQKLDSGKFKILTENEGKELLNTKLKCNKCEYYPNNMPDLKNHLLIHA